MESTNDISINSLFDKKYISFLNKIEKEYHLNENEISFQDIKDKFSIIYNELNKFNFEKMSVEFTYDNALVFAIKNNNNKYLLQYFVNYNANAEDDVEVIFSNLSKNSNNFTEVKLEQDKNKYSEEEVINLLYERERECKLNLYNHIFDYQDTKEWFEQIKNK
jgi:hypothetical protein